MGQQPRVGVGVIIRKDKKILLLKRKNAHGDGDWAFIGGHLEFGESVEECARREVKEECGLELGKISLGPYTNDIFIKEDKHYLTVFAIADHSSGEPVNLEPEKCEELRWFSWDQLPENLFVPVRNLKQTGFDPFR